MAVKVRVAPLSFLKAIGRINLPLQHSIIEMGWSCVASLLGSILHPPKEKVIGHGLYRFNNHQS